MRLNRDRRCMTYRYWAAIGAAGVLADDIASRNWILLGVMAVVVAYMCYLFSLDFGEWQERRKHPNGMLIVACGDCGWQHIADPDDPETPLIVNAHHVMCDGDKPAGGVL